MPFLFFRIIEMSLLNRIKERLNHARKAEVRNEQLISLLTTFYGESARIGKDNGNVETADADVVKVAKRFIDGIATIKQHAVGNEKLIAQCDFETSVLAEYIPKQLTEEELKTKVVYLLGNNPGMKMGDVMAHFKTHWAGLYDGKVLSNIVKARMT
jgi:uncharacterized protein YqeY